MCNIPIVSRSVINNNFNLEFDMSISFKESAAGVECLHLYPKIGIELEYNHYVIPFGDEMCVEIKRGKKGIKAKVETLTAQELSLYYQQKYCISVVAANILKEIAIVYEELKEHKAMIKNFKPQEEPVDGAAFDGYEVCTTITNVVRTSCGQRMSMQLLTSFYFNFEVETVPLPICVQRYPDMRDGEVVEKKKVILESPNLNASNIMKSSVMGITEEMATSCYSVFLLKQRIAELRAQLPEEGIPFPEPPPFDEV